MEYRDTTKNLREIARELSVANIMEGSVQRAGDRVRINVQLIDAATDEHLWAEIYDRELTTNNLFDIQSEIAKAIATALKATLTDTELASVADVPTDNVQAYDLYLQARRFTQSQTKSEFQTAIELFKEVLALDPGFKMAWIDLANGHMTNYWVYGGDPADREFAREAIDRAKAIDPDFAELYVAEGFYWYWGYLDYERALYNLDKAIEMMPGNDEAHMWRGYVSRRADQWDQAVSSMQHSLKLNPRMDFSWFEYAQTQQYLHQYGQATEAAKRAQQIDPSSFWGKSALASIALQARGDAKTAVQLTIGAQHYSDEDFLDYYIQARVLGRRFDEVLETVRKLTLDMEIQRGAVTLSEDLAAQILYFMGRKDEARQAASAALFRLHGIRAELGQDYRIDLAELRVTAIQGASQETIEKLAQKSRLSMPKDALQAFQIRAEHARIFAIAGMTAESIEMLESVLLPPSQTSVYIVDLDPAYDDIREDPEFVAMMERYR